MTTTRQAWGPAFPHRPHRALLVAVERLYAHFWWTLAPAEASPIQDPLRRARLLHMCNNPLPSQLSQSLQDLLMYVAAGPEMRKT